MFAAFQQEGEDYLMESLSYVDGDIVDAVLESALLEFGLLALHLLPVGGGNLGGVEPDGVAALEVDEAVGPRVVVEL